MGLRLFSRDSYDCNCNCNDTPNQNPDPSNWKIVEWKQFDEYLVVKIHYPDCTNYEGVKILVYENMTLPMLKKQKKIDPHFSENKEFKSPIARFEPTEDGWFRACFFCENMCRTPL